MREVEVLGKGLHISEVYCSMVSCSIDNGMFWGRKAPVLWDQSQVCFKACDVIREGDFHVLAFIYRFVNAILWSFVEFFIRPGRLCTFVIFWAASSIIASYDTT